MTCIKWIAILGVGTVAISSSSQSAAQGLALGRSQLHLFISEGVTQDNNVDRATNGTSDFYKQQSVGARWSRATDVLSLQSTVWLSEQRYNEFTEKNCRNWGLGGTAQISTDQSFLTATGSVKKQGDSDDSSVTDSVSAEIEDDTAVTFDQTNRSESRSLYNFQLSGEHQLSDITSLLATYNFYQIDYDQSAMEGWYDQSFGSELALKLSPTVAAYMSGQISLQGGGGAPDNGRGYMARIGLKNSTTAKTSFRLGLGMQYYTSESEEYMKPSVELSARWQATDKLTFFALCRDSIQPIGSADLMEWVLFGSLDATYQMCSSTRLTLSGSTLRGKYLDATRVDGQMKKPITIETTGTALLSYSPHT